MALPSSVPYLLSVMKVNIGLCLVGVVIGEFIGARQGLGFLIIYSSQIFKLDWMILSIILLCIIAMILYQAVSLVEKRVVAVASALVNGLLLLPAYGKAFGMPVDTFVEMGAAIIPAIHSLTTFCLFSVAPFNIIKGIVVSLITLVLYKHISRLLKGSQA